MTTPEPRHLSNIQILRGIAAVMVLVYHIGNEFADRDFPGGLPAFGAGSAGVDVFFVMSGFIVVFSTASAFGRPGASALFLARRAVRLVPLYWIVTTVFVGVMIWQVGPAELSGQTWLWFAASYAFLFYPHDEGGDFPLYAQGWTLNFEMVFYLGCAGALMARRATALWILSVGLVLLAVIGRLVAPPWPFDRWADTNMFEFALGIGLAQAQARGARLSITAAAALAAAGFATFALTIDSVDAWLPYRGFVWGPPALAVVAAAALSPRPKRAGRLRRALEALGEASYSLYLVHDAFFLALGAGLERLFRVRTISPWLYGAMCFFGAFMLAFATFHGIERPITRSLNRRFGLARRWSDLTSGRPSRR